MLDYRELNSPMRLDNREDACASLSCEPGSKCDIIPCPTDRPFSDHELLKLKVWVHCTPVTAAK